MAKDPAFLFYSSDFLTGTALLTHEEIGKYIILLCHMHQHGELKKEQMQLLVGNLSDNLMDKFRLTERNTYINERLLDEVEKRKKFTESRRLNGKKGGRKAHALPIGLPNGLASENLPENENINKDVLEGGMGEGYKFPLVPAQTGAEVIFTIEHCLEVAMNDGRWLSANKTNRSELEAFNKSLEKAGTYQRNPMEWKKHFANWKAKNGSVLVDQEPASSSSGLLTLIKNAGKQHG